MFRSSLFTAAALVASVAATTLFAGCATAVNDAVDGLTPAGDDDSAGDAGDSGTAKKDSGKSSSGTDSGGSSVGDDDAGDGTTGTDSSVPTDSGTVSTDAGTIVTDSGTIVTDSGTVAIDAGTTASCAPTSVTGLATKSHSAAGLPGDCATSEINAFWTACLDPVNATQSACNNLQNGISGIYCTPCLLSNSTDSKWGAVVLFPAGTGNTLSLNAGGCYAAAASGSTQCRNASQYASECDHAACDSVCAATDADYQSCLSTAESGACATYAQSETTQCAAYAQTGCAPSGTFEASFKSIAAIMCGP